jgi:hypothetical protein
MSDSFSEYCNRSKEEIAEHEEWQRKQEREKQQAILDKQEVYRKAAEYDKLDTEQDFIQILYDNPNGADCPTCGRYAKIYHRSLNSCMAQFLIYLNKKSGDGTPWIHVQSQKDAAHLLHGGDHAKLRHWKLIEEMPNIDAPSKKCSGNWRITEKGKMFARNEITVPGKVVLLFNECLGFSEDHVTISQALGEDFNYPELMAA